MNDKKNTFLEFSRVWNEYPHSFCWVNNWMNTWVLRQTHEWINGWLYEHICGNVTFLLLIYPILQMNEWTKK